MMAPPLLRFQTKVLGMWINKKLAVSDENQESIQKLQISFSSGGIEYLILINKSMGFSQSLSGILKVVIY